MKHGGMALRGLAASFRGDPKGTGHDIREPVMKLGNGGIPNFEKL